MWRGAFRGPDAGLQMLRRAPWQRRSCPGGKTAVCVDAHHSARPLRAAIGRPPAPGKRPDLPPPHTTNSQPHPSAGTQAYRNAEYFNNLIWPNHQLTLGELALFISHLANMGYAIVSREDNVLCPHCSELTLLRVDVQ